MEKRKLHRMLTAMGMAASVGVASSAGAVYYDAPVSFKLDGVDAGPRLVADFNADGIDDLAVVFPLIDRLTGAVTSRVNFLAGNATGSLQIESTVPLPIDVSDAAVGDFDGDGQNDLALTVRKAAGSSDPYCGTADGVAVFFGWANGIQPELRFAGCAVPSAPGPLATLDADGDGFDDLVIGDRVYLGDGAGAFSPAGSLPQGAKFIADIDGNGLDDVMTDGAASCSLGDGTFAPCAAIANGPLVKAGPSGKLPRRVDPATGTVLSYDVLDAASPVSSLIRADVNGDGIEDIVGWAVTSQATPSWDEWYSCPIGAYPPSGTVFSPTSTYSVGMAQRDARIASYRNKYVAVFNGIGSNYYVLRSVYLNRVRAGQSVTRADAVPIAQVQADWSAAYGLPITSGRRVVITRPFRKARGGNRQGGRFYGSGYVTGGNGSTGPSCTRYFQLPAGVDPAQLGYRHVVLDGESIPKTVALRVTLIHADGSRQEVMSPDMAGIFRRIEVTDIDGDGVLDVLADFAQIDQVASQGQAQAVLVGSGTMVAFKGNGDGTFSTTPSATSLTTDLVDKGDYNGDGLDDFGRIGTVAGSENVYHIAYHVAPSNPASPAPVPAQPAPATPQPAPAAPAPVQPTGQATPTSVIESAGTVSEAGVDYFVVNGTRITIGSSSSMAFQDGFGPVVKVGDPVQFKAQAYSDGSVVLIAAEIG